MASMGLYEIRACAQPPLNSSFSQKIGELYFIKGDSQITLYHYILTTLLYFKPVY